MDIRKVRKLIELIEETGVAEIEIKEGEESVRISRNLNHTMMMAPQPAPAPGAALFAPQADDPAPEVVSPNEVQGHPVKSPMVGTFYASSSPDSKPFVNVGQRVKKGEVLCIVEAMKMFNQIEADTAGVIAARLVDNGDPVEYGQALFIIKDDE